MRRTSGGYSLVTGATLAAALVIVPASEARAHFVLQAPASWMSQDTLGLPQKLGPCGDEYDGTSMATPTNTVTTLQEGQTITVTINEVIFHPGHYRIALAINDRSELPAEPVVTAASTPCGSAAIESPPVFPVLADDVFDHTTPFTAPQSIKITLPNVTCTKCTLQIIEFMGNHALNDPGGCFYHHCADIAIEAATGSGSEAGSDSGGGTGLDAGEGSETGAGTDAGVDAGAGSDAGAGAGVDAAASMAAAPDAGPRTTTPASSGCGCSMAPPEAALAGTWAFGLGAAGWFGRRRWRLRQAPRG